MKAVSMAVGTLLIGSILLTGCGQNKEQSEQPASSSNTTETKQESGNEQSTTNNTENSSNEATGTAGFTEAAKALVDGMKKGAEAGKIDWAQSHKLYTDNVKSVVKSMDDESESQTDEQLEAALKAGEEGSFSAGVVAQLYDKLLQKTAFLMMRHDFKEANGKFSDQTVAAQELAEAREVYDGILKGMVEKRDKAYGTLLLEAIDGGFDQMKQSVEKGDNLAYNLGKQVVDKTLMKAFYLAAGAEKGYGYKIEQAVKENSLDEAKVEQAEGWAFFQSLKKYLEEYDKESADFIESQFDLSGDIKKVQGEKINQAFVRAFAATAQGEYGETFENWGKDKAAITAMEGALFLDAIRLDLPKALGGEEQGNQLLEQAQKLLDAVKSGDKANAESTFKNVEASIEKLKAYGK